MKYDSLLLYFYDQKNLINKMELNYFLLLNQFLALSTIVFFTYKKNEIELH